MHIVWYEKKTTLIIFKETTGHNGLNPPCVLRALAHSGATPVCVYMRDQVGTTTAADRLRQGVV